MEHSNSSSRIYTIEDNVTDYSISTLVGLSIGVVTTIFAFTLWAIQIANIHMNIFQAHFHVHGDTSLLYFAVFLICASMLIVIQYHFQQKFETEQNNQERK